MTAELTFSNSSMIHQVSTKETMTITVFGYLILISLDFYNFISVSIFSLVLVLILKIWKCAVFDHIISKHLKVRHKYSATCHIFNSLLGVWNCGQTWSFMFDILLTSPVVATWPVIPILTGNLTSVLLLLKGNRMWMPITNKLINYFMAR